MVPQLSVLWSQLRSPGTPRSKCGSDLDRWRRRSFFQRHRQNLALV